MNDVPLCLTTGTFWLPRAGEHLAAWACVACDQFTSQPEYWQQVEALVGNKPSTYRMIVPECYLAEAPERIPQVHARMTQYLEQGTLEPQAEDGFILTLRHTESGMRPGLVALIDLECYDYQKGSTSPIRATEGTILERIPPRMAVRRGGALEMSHVLLLVNDPAHRLFPPLLSRRTELPKLYDFSLMQGGGRVEGYAVTQPQDVSGVREALQALKDGLTGENPFLYAVGDGNHSLAAAKACWEEVKASLTPAQQLAHPARFALVELENLQDPALVFEPIHRLVTGVQGEALLTDWQAFAKAQGMAFGPGENTQHIRCLFGDTEREITLSGSPHPLAVGTLQAFLDAWLEGHPTASLDYVHGREAVQSLTQGTDAVGFLLPKPDKEGLFESVQRMGALPRKTFSMGEAHEKRYYLETRPL